MRQAAFVTAAVFFAALLLSESRFPKTKRRLVESLGLPWPDDMPSKMMH